MIIKEMLYFGTECYYILGQNVIILRDRSVIIVVVCFSLADIKYAEIMVIVGVAKCGKCTL